MSPTFGFVISIGPGTNKIWVQEFHPRRPQFPVATTTSYILIHVNKALYKCIIQPGQVDLILKHVSMSWFGFESRSFFWSHLDSNFSRDLNAGAHLRMRLLSFAPRLRWNWVRHSFPSVIQVQVHIWVNYGPEPSSPVFMHAYGKWS